MDSWEEFPEVIWGAKPSKYSALYVQFMLQLQCQWKDLNLKAGIVATMIGQYLFLAFIIGIVCRESHLTALSLSRLTVTLISLSRFINVFERDKLRYLSGQDGILFHPVPIYLAKLLVNSAFFSSLYFPYTVIVYPLAGLRPGIEHALSFFTTLVLQQIAAISLGFMLSAGIRDRRVAQTVASTIAWLNLSK